MILLFDFATQFPFYTKFDCHHSLSVIIWSVHLKAIALAHNISYYKVTTLNSQSEKDTIRRCQTNSKKNLKNSLTRLSINQRNEQKTDFSSKYQIQEQNNNKKILQVPSCQEFRQSSFHNTTAIFKRLQTLCCCSSRSERTLADQPISVREKDESANGSVA